MSIVNRKARFEYHILDTMEAGIVLKGTEVKSVRKGNVNMGDAYAFIKHDEVWIENLYIAPYDKGNIFNCDPRQKRKVLLHKSEILKLKQKLQGQSTTLIPLKMYLKRGKIKIELSIAKGKKLHDKRNTIKTRDTEREIRRLQV